MKLYFTDISAENRAPCFLLFCLVFLFCVCCGITNTPGSKTLEIKSNEKRLEEYYKKLPAAEELTLVTVVSSENVFTNAEFSVEKGKRFPNYSFERIKNEVEKKGGRVCYDFL